VRILVVPFAVLALAPFQSSIAPLPPAVKKSLVAANAWQRGCPLPLTGLRLLTVTYLGFDDRQHAGQIVVSARHATGLAKVFRKLYTIRFPIRHMSLAMYGPPRRWPAHGDLTGSFECRQAVPSPCAGGTGTGSWSEHAYGEAIDLNPIENPYVGCGMSREQASRPYIDRSRLRKGMITPGVVAAFRSIGWGWGGAWSGSTKDYMHFSESGH
jgi:D-alanyl-D-alanine carboxypeptidase-like protein